MIHTAENELASRAGQGFQNYRFTYLVKKSVELCTVAYDGSFWTGNFDSFPRLLRKKLVAALRHSRGGREGQAKPFGKISGKSQILTIKTGHTVNCKTVTAEVIFEDLEDLPIISKITEDLLGWSGSFLAGLYPFRRVG